MDDRPTLTDLAIQHQTDKWGSHYYTPHYEHHFKHLRDEPNPSAARASPRGGKFSTCPRVDAVAAC